MEIEVDAILNSPIWPLEVRMHIAGYKIKHCFLYQNNNFLVRVPYLFKMLFLSLESPLYLAQDNRQPPVRSKAERRPWVHQATISLPRQLHQKARFPRSSPWLREEPCHCEHLLVSSKRACLPLPRWFDVVLAQEDLRHALRNRGAKSNSELAGAGGNQARRG